MPPQQIPVDSCRFSVAAPARAGGIWREPLGLLRISIFRWVSGLWYIPHTLGSTQISAKSRFVAYFLNSCPPRTKEARRRHVAQPPSAVIIRVTPTRPLAVTNACGPAGLAHGGFPGALPPNPRHLPPWANSMSAGSHGLIASHCSPIMLLAESEKCQGSGDSVPGHQSHIRNPGTPPPDPLTSNLKHQTSHFPSQSSIINPRAFPLSSRPCPRHNIPRKSPRINP